MTFHALTQLQYACSLISQSTSSCFQSLFQMLTSYFTKSTKMDLITQMSQFYLDLDASSLISFSLPYPHRSLAIIYPIQDYQNKQ